MWPNPFRDLLRRPPERYRDSTANRELRARPTENLRAQPRVGTRSWAHTTDETAHRGLTTQHVVGEDLNVQEDAWLNLRRAGPTRHGKSSRTHRAGRCGLGDIKNKDMSRGRQEGRAARLTKNIATAKNRLRDDDRHGREELDAKARQAVASRGNTCPRQTKK